ncbi:hypothetical protein L1887_01039 [Cichorium endivia]|nr:hypothetical protein L1887_01039 [Cichorium endivia]
MGDIHGEEDDVDGDIQSNSDVSLSTPVDVVDIPDGRGFNINLDKGDGKIGQIGCMEDKGNNKCDNSVSGPYGICAVPNSLPSFSGMSISGVYRSKINNSRRVLHSLKLKDIRASSKSSNSISREHEKTIEIGKEVGYCLEGSVQALRDLIACEGFQRKYK